MTTPDVSNYIETVHRLSNLGAVVTSVTHGTSQEGFDAEWRVINVLTVEGDLINRFEIFDEADIDAAIARFEELQPQAPRLENTASRVLERFLAHFAARDWDALTEILADDLYSDDRRRVVGAGIRHGRDAEIANMRTAADLGVTKTTSTSLRPAGTAWPLRVSASRAAIRDPRHSASRCSASSRSTPRSGSSAIVAFDLDDIDAAFEELDARYLAGEAAPIRTRGRQLGMNTIGELNRHERGPMIGRFAYADHRRIPFASGEEFGRRGRGTCGHFARRPLSASKAVHALDALGTVATLVIEGTDAHGGELQWGRIILFGSEEPRVEVYEEETSMPRSHGLRNCNRRRGVLKTRQAKWRSASGQLRGPRLGRNGGTVTDDISTDDRRRVVNAGVRRGRDAHIADMRAIAEVWVENITSDRHGDPWRAPRPQSYLLLGPRPGPRRSAPRCSPSSRSTADKRIVARVVFDLDDIDAAFEELDARYLAGEAAAHAHTWSVIARAYAAFNRHELPATTRTGSPSTTGRVARSSRE